MLNTERAKNIGYSLTISDPAFASQSAGDDKKSRVHYLLFILPALLCVLLCVGGLLSPFALIVLLAACAMLALPFTLKERKDAEDQTFDGEIVTVTRHEPVFRANAQRIDAITRGKMVLHTFHIKDEKGVVHIYEHTGDLLTDYRTYYREGDSVRHHKGFALPEKYDKSADESVVCIVCGRIGSMDSRKCGGCSAPLLK